MKHNKKTIMLSMILCMLGHVNHVKAYDWSESTLDGVTIYFSYANAARTEWTVSSVKYSSENASKPFTGAVVIPSSVNGLPVTAISGNYAFNCSGITTVTIPNTVTWIGNYSFYGCKDLVTITIPNSVTAIGKSAFNGCSSLKTITIGSGVSMLGLKFIANCPKLEDVYCYVVRYPDISESIFEDSYVDYMTLHVPANSVNQYKKHRVWGKFMAVVPITDEEMDINRVSMPNSTDAPTVIYNLKGQRIVAPTKGVNIINGLKVVIR
jgi:hypothetical protein